MIARRPPRARLSDERGIALVMALGIMLVLTLTLTTVVFFTSASARDAQRSVVELRVFRPELAFVAVPRLCLALVSRSDLLLRRGHESLLVVYSLWD